MGWFSRFFRSREKLLSSNEPERAFAPDPSADVWQLSTGTSNEQAFDLIRKHGVALLRVSTGESASLSTFASGALLFATVWEPYSAKTIGAMKKTIDAGQSKPFAIVFFENTRDEIAESKKSSWYYANAYVLAPETTALRTLIGRVPFQVHVGADGQVQSIVEGKA